MKKQASALALTLVSLLGSGTEEPAGVPAPEAAILSELARRPYDAALYRQALELARGRMDGEGQMLHWGKWLYWSLDYAGRTAEADQVGLELAKIHPGWNADRTTLDAWRSSVLAAVDAASRAKQYRLAGHLLGKLLDLDPADAELTRAYEQLFDKAGGAASGGAFTAERVRRKSPKWLADQNRKHAAWEKAFEKRTKHYKIITNISYEFAETVAVVMEEMFDFYQDVYGYRKVPPVVTLAIHRKRSDFDRYCLEMFGESYQLGMGGWFYDKEMTVAAYDRSETGQDLTDLYRVLFHEASHQFMHLLTKKTQQRPPTWLNEGTASYFEGCELQADGSIVKNKPALGRIREWEGYEAGDERHSLEDLVTCAHRDYDVTFYSYGWSLVYFLNNYENAAGELVYRQPYLDYLNSYTKKGPRDEEARLDESLRRAKEYFVDGVGDPEVGNWDAFENRWRTFVRAVVADTKKGEDFAQDLQERCRAYLDRRDFERALILAEQADDRRPQDLETFRLLALANEGLGRADVAAFWMTRHWELAWCAGDQDLADQAEKWLADKESGHVVQLYCNATRAMVSATEADMRASAEAGYPTLALLFASHALRALGLAHPVLSSLRAKMQSMCNEDLRLWQHAFAKEATSNQNWDGIDVVRYEHDGVIVNNPKEFGWPVERTEQPSLLAIAAPFDVRGHVQVDGKGTAYLLFGIGRNGRARARIAFDRGSGAPLVSIHKVDVEVDGETGSTTTVYEPVAGSPVADQAKIPFEVRLRADGGEVVVGETLVPLPAGWDMDRFDGSLALTVEDGSIALFSDIEVRPGEPFWPVEPAQ